MEAFRASPLGGRITARNVVISTSDYTVSILRLNLTWRYWLFQMTRVSLFFMSMQHDSPDEEDSLTADDNKKLPTSIQLLMDGVEVFMYNRSPPYDSILEALRKTDSGEKEALFRFSTTLAESLPSPKSSPNRSLLSSGRNVESPPSTSPLKFPLSLLPIQIRIKRGAVVVGNPTTPSILVASFKSGNALLDLSKSPCILDHYRTAFDITMEKFQISLKSNISYDPTRYTEHAPVDQVQKKKVASRHEHLRYIKNIVERILTGGRRRHHHDDQSPSDWRGLRRYIDDFEDEKVMEFSDIEEYAKYSLILDTASTHFKYFFDCPGENPSDLQDSPTSYPPPEFGVDIIFSMATIHYGSWADRQRGPIQAMLFPPLSRDSMPTPVCTDPGAPRCYSGFNLRISTNDEIIFRLPTRELSKDKESLTSVGGNRNQKVTRPFGWLEFKLRENSKISYFTSYLANASGWRNKLSVQMDRLEARTSVNHDIMFSADEHTLDCDIGFPLQWNGKCVWNFNNRTKNGRFFFLSEHTFLLTDVISDFASGAPMPYEYHRQFEYQLNWEIHNYKLYFNVNDNNIINDPLDFNNNKYLCFKGDRLNVELIIPLDGPFSKSAKIDYKVSTTSLDLFLEVPPWHTVSAFMKGNKKMGSADGFEISGYYQYFKSIEVDHNNFAVINAIGDNVTLVFFGYFIKYLFIFRENYFGDFRHFKTFEEYTNGSYNGLPTYESGSDSQSAGYTKDPDYWNILKTENDLNVLFTFLVRTGLIVLPCHIYDHGHHIGILFDNLDVDIHLCHFYMDLQADFSTAFGYYFQTEPFTNHNRIWNIPLYRQYVVAKNPDIIIDGFSVHTHRMFGLAPDLLTYHCKWDFASGFIKIEGEPACITGLKAIVSNFALGFKDLENTLVYKVPIVYDMANFTFRCPELILKLTTGVAATFLEVNLTDILVGFNDIANERYSSRVILSIPSIVIKVIDKLDGVAYEASLKTSLTFSDICQKAKMLEHRTIQQLYVRQSDAPTHRVPFHIFPQNKDNIYMDAYGSLFSSVSLPKGSFPLTKEYDKIHSDKESSVDNDNEDTSLFSFNYDDDMNPSVRYYDEEFCPQTPYLPGYKHDTFVLEFGTMDLFITPEGTRALGSLTTAFQNLDLQFLIDKLQVETVKQLKMLIIPISMVDNIRFVCPTMNVKLVENSLASPDMVFCTSPLVPAATITILEISLALSKMTTRKRQGFTVLEQDPLTYALHSREVFFSVHDPNFFVSGLTIHLSDIESWGTKDDNDGLISSTSVKNLQTTIETACLDWTLHFLKLIQNSFSTSMVAMKSASTTASMWRKELIHTLTMAAKDSNLQHDPGAITKPAAILRSCEDHVRNYDSWKLITKLRSILNNLPDYEAQRHRFLMREWHNPENSLEEVIALFNTWRPWEGDMAQRSQFFRNVFGVTSEDVNKSFQILFCLAYTEIKISKAGSERDTLSLHGVTSSTSITYPPLPNPQDGVCSSQTTTSIFNIEAFDGSLSPTSIDTIETIKKFKANNEEEESLDSTNHDKQSNTKSLTEDRKTISLLFHLKLFHLRLSLPHSFCELYTYDNMSSCEIITSDNMEKSVSVVSQSKEYSISFGQNYQEFVSSSFRGLCLVFFGILGKRDSKSLDVQLSEVEFKVLDGRGELCPLLEKFVKEDLKLFNSIKSANKEAAPKTEDESFNLPNFKISVLLGQTTALIELLHPVRIHNSTSHCNFTFAHDNGNVMFKYSHRVVSFDLGLLDTPILHYEHSKMAVLARLATLPDMSLVSGNLDLGYLKVTDSLLMNSLELVIKYKLSLEERFKFLQAIADGVSQSEGSKQDISRPKLPKSNFMEHLAVKLNINLEYFGISTYKDHCRYTLEFEGLTWVFANFDRSNLGQTTPLWGELTVPATRITILDPLFSVGLSTLLDFNFSVKILNDNTTEEANSAQSLQIESQYFRVCLSPPVLFKLVELADGFTRVSKIYEQRKKETTEMIEVIDSIDNLLCQKEADQNTSGWNKINFSSVHVLSYNFCVGWLFGFSHKDYPGFILGAERFFAVTKADIGKLTLMEGYLSVANGSTTSSFYSMLSEASSLNRAYMAQMQLNYCVSNTNGLCIDLIGDELDVRFMSNSISMFERAIQCGSEVQSFFEQRSKDLIREKQGRAKFEQIESKPTPTKQKNISAFNPKFTSIQMTLKYAGSKVYIYRLQEDSLDNPPSLSVNSPAVLIAVFYEHQKHQPKKHIVKIEILMSPSDNTLYSSCVPVVMDFIEASKLMFRTSKPVPEEALESGTTEAPKEKTSEISDSIGKILKEVSFHFGLIIEKQRISLSCEPTAKVAGVVEFDGGSFHASTGLDDSNSIYILAQLDAISASLQHIYSDERSGSIDIKSIMFSNIINFEPTIDVVSSISVTGVIAYVKMKQYQDLDLFKDIWYPKKYQVSHLEREDQSKAKLVPQKSSYSKFREVSSTYAIPVALTLIISNISLEVDFGAALGIMILDLDSTWAISRKTSNWFYELQFGLQTLLIGFEGRLGGYLKVERLFLNSAIEWKFEEMPYLDIPLVVFAAGFQNVHFKIAFDNHVFAFANLEAWRLDAFNRKNGINISKDHLYVIIKYGTVEIFLTSLAASDFYDIFSTISRLIEEKRTSYKEILEDSNKEHFLQEKIDPSKLIEVAKKLETKIEVNTGVTTVQIYPQSLNDSRALVISLDKSQANFLQNEYHLGITNEVELQLNNLNASLATTAGIKAEQIDDFGVKQFVEYARKAKGGNILGFPKFMISMRTYQKYDTNIVEFLFQSSFGATVDVRWNLGSVNLVRDMYAAHKRAFSSRVDYRREEMSISVKEGHDIKDKVFEEDKFAEVDPGEELKDPENSRRDILNDLNEKLDKVAKDTKFQYVALAPPVIEAPQLKELGNATPPLEWFGLHRNKFPDATHQFVIVTLQKLIHEIEQKYSKALGDA